MLGGPQYVINYTIEILAIYSASRQQAGSTQ